MAPAGSPRHAAATGASTDVCAGSSRTCSLHSSSLLAMCLYGVSFIAFGLQVNLLGPTASVIASKLHVAEADLGLVFGLNGLASIIGGLPSGWLVDKLPGHAVLAGALALQALGYVCIPRCSTLWQLEAAFAFCALSWNLVNTAGNTLTLRAAAATAAAAATTSSSDGDDDDADDQDGSSRSPSAVAINLVNACFGVGSLGAPLLADWCATRLQRPLAAYGVTAAVTLASAATFLVVPSPPPLDAATNSAPGDAADGGAGGGGSSSSLQQPLLAAAGGGADDAGADTATGATAPWWRRMLQPGPGPLLLIIIALFNFLNVGTEVGFGGWIFTYGVQYAGMSEHASHSVNAVYWLVFTLGRVLASAGAALGLAPVALLLSSLPLALVGAGLALATPLAWLTGPDGVLLLSCVTALIGLGAAPGFANALALLDSYWPGGCSGSITGLLGGLAGAGCMTVPFAIAAVAKHSCVGFQALMWVTGVSFAAQLACIPAALVCGSRMRDAGAAERRPCPSVTSKLGLPPDDEAQAPDCC